MGGPGDVDFFRLDVARLARCRIGGGSQQPSTFGLHIEVFVDLVDLGQGQGIDLRGKVHGDRGAAVRHDADWLHIEEGGDWIGPAAGGIDDDLCANLACTRR
ncbi:hypothetical protein D9M68_1000190 [compost metagenome]